MADMADPDVDARPMARTYVSVLIVQVVVLLLLWAAGRWFGRA